MRDDRERLADILEAAAKIAARVRKGRVQFDADEDLQIVLTHLVQMLGEAASRVSRELMDRHTAVPWRQIVGMRNRVVHDYFEVDLDILWVAASVDVPRLARQIEEIVDQLGPLGEVPSDTAGDQSR